MAAPIEIVALWGLDCVEGDFQKPPVKLWRSAELLAKGQRLLLV